MVQKPSLEPRLGLPRSFFRSRGKITDCEKKLRGRPGSEATKNLRWLFHSNTSNPLLQSKTCRNPQNTDVHNPKKLCHHPLPPDNTEPCFMKFNLRFCLTWQHQISSKMCRVCHFLVITSDRGSNQGLSHPPPPSICLPQYYLAQVGAWERGYCCLPSLLLSPATATSSPLHNEKWVSTLFMLWGIVPFGYILGGLTSMLTNSDAQRSRYIHHQR